jgi:sec-independent protein translocase protein TatA
MPGNIGIMELVVVLVLVLIIFGPKRLPELGRSVGRGIREFKGSLDGKHDDADDDKPQKTNAAADDGNVIDSTATEEPVATPAGDKQESSTGA